jgi:hypothetical protein
VRHGFARWEKSLFGCPVGSLVLLTLHRIGGLGGFVPVIGRST